MPTNVPDIVVNKGFLFTMTIIYCKSDGAVV